MLKISLAACAVALFARAAAAAPSAIPSTVQASLQAQAQKDCDAALDASRFDYSTMEECVSDKTERLERAYRGQMAAQSGHSQKSTN